MARTAMINARTERELKKEVEEILHDLGISTTEAINIFFRQVKLRRGLPFPVEIPNEATLKVFKDSEEGKGLEECLMRTPVYTKRFEKDLKLMIRRGHDPESIKSILRRLIDEIPLEQKHRDHLLIGNFKDRRECHITPDWLLIYRLEEDIIIFERTGTHADLFK